MSAFVGSVREEIDQARAAAYRKGWDEAYAVAFARGKSAGEASSHQTIMELRKKIAALLMNKTDPPASLVQEGDDNGLTR